MSLRDCGVCNYTGTHFHIPSCGHGFHFRCIGQWPIMECPLCKGIASTGIEMTNDQHKVNVPVRNGKWLVEEETYMETMIDYFLEGIVFAGNGTSIRLILSKILNCSPMRLSKKFQKKALGKHTFRLPQGRSVISPIHPMDHRTKMKHLSQLQYEYYQALENNQPSDKMHVQLACHVFWQQQLLHFCKSIQQPVLHHHFHIPPSPSRQRKRFLSLSSQPMTPWVQNTPKYTLKRVSPNQGHSPVCKKSKTFNLPNELPSVFPILHDQDVVCIEKDEFTSDYFPPSLDALSFNDIMLFDHWIN